MIRHGHLSRDMFDLTGLNDPNHTYSVATRYSWYQTSNYPITFVCFANKFSDWLLGKDDRERLGLIDLISMIKAFSWLHIKITSQADGAKVVVRAGPWQGAKVLERVLVED